VHIAIATSTDSGATWIFQAAVSQASAVTISTSDPRVCGASLCAGTLVQETSSIVLDPTDPDANRRLKVFAHEYFFGSGMNFALGYLAMWTASVPAGPWTETKLFGWPSKSPISTSGVAYDVHTAPELAALADCLIVGEPGAIVRSDGTLDLALACPAPGGGTATIDIRLVRSTDHGRSWRFVAKLLTPMDADVLGSTQHMVSGPDLFYANGGYHLLVTPIGLVNFSTGTVPGSRGCIVLPIADLEGGVVTRCGGAPVIEAAYRGQPGQFVGACTAAPGATATGVLIPVPDVSQPTVSFRIFAARQGLP
jgi:hypothetical protein